MHPEGLHLLREHALVHDLSGPWVDVEEEYPLQLVHANPFEGVIPQTAPHSLRDDGRDKIEVVLLEHDLLPAALEVFFQVFGLEGVLAEDHLIPDAAHTPHNLVFPTSGEVRIVEFGSPILAKILDLLVGAPLFLLVPKRNINFIVEVEIIHSHNRLIIWRLLHHNLIRNDRKNLCI